MLKARRRVREVTAALNEAGSYEVWLEAAEAYDALTGADAWRSDPECEYYDAAALRDLMTTSAAYRRDGDPLGLAEHLNEGLYRHLNDIAAPELYGPALAGTKHLVEAFLSEAETALRWLASFRNPLLTPEQRLHRFEQAAKVFGRTALMLSGGATLGFHHLGVVKGLLDQGLLPSILSGSSTGAMVAAGICTRTDAELEAMYEDPEQIRLDGLKRVAWRRAVAEGAMLDPSRLQEVLDNNVGDYTFAQAFRRSGRALAISVSPTRHRQKPRLLNHLTSPEVLVTSAVMASSALPGLFPPVQLMARGVAGARPYVEGERWVDGSIHGDLPKLRLSRLHNVNHFIVSQTNPHVLPFVLHHGRSGFAPALGGLVSAAARSQLQTVAEVGRRAIGSGPGGRIAALAHSLVSQDYRGDIDLHPQFRWSLYRKVVSNPTRADLAAFIAEGQRSVWPRVAQIRDQTRIGQTFEACVAALRAEVS